MGGDYVGVHPMGLFCCLKPKRAFQRLIKKDVMNSPLCICLDLYDSVCWLETVRIPPKASQIVHRWFAGPGVKREQIREGRVRGALFLPPGENYLCKYRTHILYLPPWCVCAIGADCWDGISLQPAQLGPFYSCLLLVEEPSPGPKSAISLQLYVCSRLLMEVLFQPSHSHYPTDKIAHGSPRVRG